VLTLWRLDANLLESFGLLHRPDNSFNELLDLLVQTSNISVLLSWLLVDLHGLDTAVVLGGQGIENKIGVLVHTNQVTGLQLLVVDETDERQEDGLSCGGFDDGGLAYAGRVQVDVCAFFRSFGCDVEI
jgi:hypothetical protein